MLVDMKVDGAARKVLAQANRNGFFYVLDRANGKLLAANPYVKVNWADRIDMATGRPVESEATKKRARRRATRRSGRRCSAARTGARCRGIRPPAWPTPTR